VGLAFGIVAVEVQFACKVVIFQTVEIVEQVELVGGLFFGNAFRISTAKIFYNGLGMDFFLI